jgi:hypothetical protein
MLAEVMSTARVPVGLPGPVAAEFKGFFHKDVAQSAWHIGKQPEGNKGVFQALDATIA